MLNMVDFKNGTIRLGDFIVDKSTNRKEIADRSDWKLFRETSDFTHFAYTGNLMNAELHAIRLCFKGEKMMGVELWPKTEHCMYHCISRDQDFSLFYTHLDILAKEVASWLLKKQGAYRRKYSWGKAVFRNDTDRDYVISVFMDFGFNYPEE